MPSSSRIQRIAIIGAGMAGASCARTLSDAGHAVEVHDKSRGPGGRLATRRAAWTDQSGRERLTCFDHGAPGFGVHTDKFAHWVGLAVKAGWLAEWAPRLAPDSVGLDKTGTRFVPRPRMPELCRHLLGGIACTWACSIEELRRDAHGWQISTLGQWRAKRFDAVLLALPPAQAAPLLAKHRSDWSTRAAHTPMQPCWTLMGVSARPRTALNWDVARPAGGGALAAISRNEVKPGRDQPPDEVHWVLHARADWSQEHLEQPTEQVRAAMQAALINWLGEPVAWQYAAVHRWRYSSPAAAPARTADPCWWDPASGLGVCGDFFGGPHPDPSAEPEGVERAWMSAQALSTALLANMGTPASIDPHTFDAGAA